MRKLLLLPLALLTLYLVPATASAAVAQVPATPECLQEAKQILDDQTSTSDPDEFKTWQRLVDAGCMSKNPFKMKDPFGESTSKECLSLRGRGISYLRSTNSEVKPVVRRYFKIVDKSFFRIVEISGDQAAVKKRLRSAPESEILRQRLNRLKIEKREFVKTTKDKLQSISDNNYEVLREAAARSLLAYGAMIDNRCKITGKWLEASLVVVGFEASDMIVDPRASIWF